jgi:hypothetical protein
MTAAMLDLPDRGAPFRTTTQPAAILPSMDVGAKLQIKPGQRIATVGMPGDVPPIAGESAADKPEAADVLVAFVRSKAELATVAAPAIEAARDRRGAVGPAPRSAWPDNSKKRN